MKNTKLGSVQIYYSTYYKAAVLEKIGNSLSVRNALRTVSYGCFLLLSFFLPITGE